jgi:hypothetical protein
MKAHLLLLSAVLALSACRYAEQDRTVTTTTAPAGPVTLHLASFRSLGQEQDAWFRITRDYPEIGQYRPRVVAVPYLPFTRLYELYVDGVPGAQGTTLCNAMMAHADYCAVVAAGPEVATSTTTTSSETTSTILLPPPPPTAGAPPPL